MPVITKKGKQALLNYKYVSSSKGYIDRVIMTPFWEFVVSYVPLWVAPNVITVSATLQLILCSLIFQYYENQTTSCVPSIIYFMLSLSLFIYQTLDAIDGKQARRTKQSSPLGQLFDHGNDSLTVTPMSFIGLLCVKCPKDWRFLLGMYVSYTVFFMINWRARHTHIMHFGIFSVTETQFSAIFLIFLSGVFGCQIWNDIQLFSYVFDGQLYVFNLVSLFILVVSLMGGCTSIIQYLAVKDVDGSKADNGMYYELFQYFLFVFGCCSWGLLTNVMGTHLWIYLWTCGFIFCGIIHRLVIAEVTHEKSEKYYHLLNSLWLMAVGSIWEYVFGGPLVRNMSMASDLVVYGIFIYTVGFWLHYVLNVINELCSILNIRLFVIPYASDSGKKK